MPFNFPSSFRPIPSSLNARDHENVVSINGQNHFFQVVLESDNQGDESGITEINHKYILNFVLEDFLYEFAVRGYIDIYEPHYGISNFLANTINSIAGFGATAGETCVDTRDRKDFQFDGSLTERIHVKLKPVNSSDSADQDGVNFFEKSDQHLIMYSFFITKIEDLSSDILSNKRTRIHFQDVESRSLDMLKIHEWDSSKSGGRIGNIADTPPLQNYPIGSAVVNSTTENVNSNDVARNDNDNSDASVASDLPNMSTVSMTNDEPDRVSGTATTTVTLDELNGTTPVVVPREEITVSDSTDNPTQQNGVGGTNSSNYTASRTGHAIYDIMSNVYNRSDFDASLNLASRLPQINPDYTLNPSPEVSRYKKRRWQVVGGKYVSESYTTDTFDHFDMGHPRSLLHVSPSKTTAMELLNKHLRLHVSGKSYSSEQERFTVESKSHPRGKLDCDPCFLKLNRPKNENETPYITLRSLDSYLGDSVSNYKHDTVYEGYAGEFIFEDDDIDVNAIPKKFLDFAKGLVCPDEEGKTNKTRGISQFTYNKLRNSDSNTKIVSHHVEYDNSGGGGKYSNYSDGNLVNVMYYIGEKYTKRFVSPEVYDSSDFGSRLVNVGDVSNIKKRNINPKELSNSIPTVASTIAVGRNSLINNTIFLNDSLTFRIKGDTSVETGQVIYANMLRGENNHSHDLIGGYFLVTKVLNRLAFAEESPTYITEISCVKFFKTEMSERTQRSDWNDTIFEQNEELIDNNGAITEPQSEQPSPPTPEEVIEEVDTPPDFTIV